MEKREEEEEKRLLEGVTVVDFDKLCSTVAMQLQAQRVMKLNLNGDDHHEYDYGGAVLRMWEGDLFCDSFDHRHIALQSICCPCYRFGKNMKRAGFGSCFAQGFIYLILALLALLSMLAFTITKKHCFLYTGGGFIILVGLYLGHHRTKMRNKFNIRGTDSSLDDCIFHLICPCCTLSQEARTLEMNNVQDGIWHGRGDTICVGSYSELGKAPLELSPPAVVSVKSLEP